MTAAIEARRLYKSRTDRMIDGVCGGFAEFLGVDSTLVRLGFVFLGFLGGLGIVLYLVAMIVMPTSPAAGSSAAQPSPATPQTGASKFWGIFLVVIGSIWVLSNVGLSFWHHWWGIPWGVALPILLIGAGVAFLVGGSKTAGPVGPATPDGATPGSAGPSPGTSRLFRSRTDSKLLGVCGGIGTYLNIDSTLIRILFIVAGFVSAGMMILLYIIMGMVVPREPLRAKIS
jgi:phage shock protein C